MNRCLDEIIESGRSNDAHAIGRRARSTGPVSADYGHVEMNAPRQERSCETLELKSIRRILFSIHDLHALQHREGLIHDDRI